jgi:hypothetical protein
MQLVIVAVAKLQSFSTKLIKYCLTSIATCNYATGDSCSCGIAISFKENNFLEHLQAIIQLGN